MNRLLFALALGSIIVGCTQSAPPADSSVITSRSAVWNDALNAGDIETLVELYTSDARMLPPNRAMARGSDAVRAEFGAMIAAGLTGEISTVEAQVFGDTGYHIGRYTLRAGDADVDKGKFMEIWRRDDDGEWRISNDMFNSDLAAASADDAHEHLMIVHEVEDAERWLAAWHGEDGRRRLFRENGAAHVHTFRSPRVPNLTGLVISVSDMEALEAMIDSEEGAKAAAEDGVKMETMIMLTEAD